MKMKYLTIFLGLVLCLLMSKKSVAQHCIVFEYDANGNRLERTFYNNCDKDEGNRMLIYEIEKNDELSVYPNPTKGSLTLTIPDCHDEDNSSYGIYNASGILLKSGNISGNDMTIDMGDFPSGTYMFVINCDDVLYSKTVVKL